LKNQPLVVGAPMPQFSPLPATDGKSYDSAGFTNRIVVVVFSCNHCPYVQAYEDRMIAFQRDYLSRDVRLVAINANNEANYPDDSFAKMRERAALRKFNFPYLRDEEQSAADAFGATHTPQFFVFDGERTLRYAGKMDDNWKEPEQVKETYLRDAVEALLAGKPVAVPETFSIGCTIKWK
jgi:thiol-disulfide isomerase/thioredoxin